MCAMMMFMLHDRIHCWMAICRHIFNIRTCVQDQLYREIELLQWRRDEKGRELNGHDESEWDWKTEWNWEHCRESKANEWSDMVFWMDVNVVAGILKKTDRDGNRERERKRVVVAAVAATAKTTPAPVAYAWWCCIECRHFFWLIFDSAHNGYLLLLQFGGCITDAHAKAILTMSVVIVTTTIVYVSDSLGHKYIHNHIFSSTV